MSATQPKRTSQLHLEQALLGERDPTQFDDVTRAQLGELERDNVRVLAAVPSDVFARRVQAQLESAPRMRSKWRIGFVAAPVLSACIAVAVVALPVQSQRGGDDVTRLKGLAPKLLVQRIEGGHATELVDGAHAQAGDVVQLAYVSAGRVQGVIVSIDGRGQVTLHHPEDAHAAHTLAADKTALPHSYELDDAPGFERFIFVTAPGEVDVDAVVHAAGVLAARPDARSARLPLNDALEQTSVLLNKGGP